jgi:hypothetical protein
MLLLRPDPASLATGSVDFPTRVYDNPPDLIEWLVERMLEYNVIFVNDTVAGLQVLLRLEDCLLSLPS